MAATVRLTSGTVLTTIRTPTASNATAGNVPSLLFLNPLDLTGGSNQGMANIPSEIDQFIKLMSVGDSGNSVVGWGFDYWTTAVFIMKCLQAMIQVGAPSSYSPQ